MTYTDHHQSKAEPQNPLTRRRVKHQDGKTAEEPRRAEAGEGGQPAQNQSGTTALFWKLPADLDPGWIHWLEGILEEALRRSGCRRPVAFHHWHEPDHADGPCQYLMAEARLPRSLK